MKRPIMGLLSLIMTLSLLSGFAGCAAPEKGERTEIKTITYNLLRATSDTEGNDVQTDYGVTLTDAERIRLQMEFLKRENADVVFLNELAAYQDELMPSLAAESGYAYLRVSNFGDTFATYPGYPNLSNFYPVRCCNYILYKSDRFKLLDSDAFAVSDTPLELYSVFSMMNEYDFVNVEGCPRVAVWGRLQEIATGKNVVALCTHLPYLEYGSDEAHTNFNLLGQQVLNERAAALETVWPNDVFFIGGDMNQGNVTAATGELFETVNDGTLMTHLNTSALDHIFYRNAAPLSAAIVAGELSWSDHRPVIAAFEI